MFDDIVRSSYNYTVTYLLFFFFFMNYEILGQSVKVYIYILFEWTFFEKLCLKVGNVFMIPADDFTVLMN